MVVVVKATHQTRINRVVDAKRLHAGFEAAQETTGVFAQEVEQTRGGFHHRLHVGVFGVQNAQRIGFQTATGVFVEHCFPPAMLSLLFLNGFAMTGTLFGGAETVELQAGLDAEILPQT